MKLTELLNINKDSKPELEWISKNGKFCLTFGHESLYFDKTHPDMPSFLCVVNYGHPIYLNGDDILDFLLKWLEFEKYCEKKPIEELRSYKFIKSNEDKLEILIK